MITPKNAHAAGLRLRNRTVSVLVTGALSWCTCGSAAPTQDNTTPSASSKIESIVVTARKPMDRRTLEYIVLPQFVKSHGTPGERVDQVGRWYAQVCPETVGLQPAANEYISRRIVEVARKVGAPIKTGGKCTANIKIIFSLHPQVQLDYIATNYQIYLGYSRKPNQLVKFNHAIQAWYVTGTRSSVELKTPAKCFGCIPPSANGLDIDSENWVVGQGGSYLTKDMRSEFVQITVIADANALVQIPAHTVADYIAMLVLTRTALDGCNPLPSVMDVLSRDCGEGAKPEGITETDTAYLKALYSSNLKMNVNLEQGEMRDQMLKMIETR
jgi:hypothetical protein